MFRSQFTIPPAIIDSYMSICGAEPDRQARREIRGLLEAHATTGQVLMTFVDSPTYQRARAAELDSSGPTDHAGYVDHVYRNLLQRKPDASGRGHFLSELEAGGSRRDVAASSPRPTNTRTVSSASSITFPTFAPRTPSAMSTSRASKRAGQ